MRNVLSTDWATWHSKLPSRSKALAITLFKVRFTDYPVHKSFFTGCIWPAAAEEAATLRQSHGNRRKTWSATVQHSAAETRSAHQICSHAQKWDESGFSEIQSTCTKNPLGAITVCLIKIECSSNFCGINEEILIYHNLFSVDTKMHVCYPITSHDEHKRTRTNILFDKTASTFPNDR